MGVNKQQLQAFALIEIMGHSKVVGMVTESDISAKNLLRVDVIQPDGAVNRTEYIGTGSIYRMTIITREAALALASNMQSQVRPPWAWEIPQPVSRQLEPGDEAAMEADFEENFGDYGD